MKVLIAEDDPISRTVLRKTLERWGHDVFAAPDGAQAWAAFQHETFPVVISDWMMPGLEDVVEGMEAGADDFVTKPMTRSSTHSLVLVQFE
jgi:DNA-binding response OmpR family regulator